MPTPARSNARSRTLWRWTLSLWMRTSNSGPCTQSRQSTQMRRAGRSEAAAQAYRRAIAINPDLAAAHYRLAQVYARTGDRAAAETELGLYEHLREARSKK